MAMGSLILVTSLMRTRSSQLWRGQSTRPANDLIASRSSKYETQHERQKAWLHDKAYNSDATNSS
jgi:hypothetical protein